jgi:putative redox protein
VNDELGEYKNGVNPVNRATLKWERDLVFTATTPRGYDLEFDAQVEWGCMPVEGLLMSVAGCMAIDIVSILTKMRAAPETFTMEIEGERNAEPPQRFNRIHMILHLAGSKVTPAKAEQAAALSKDKYCSVLHSLRDDIEVTVETRIAD